MREVDVNKVKEKIKELLLKANYCIGKDVKDALESAARSSHSKTEQSVLQLILENDRIAAEENIALCQDTGMAVVFIQIGQEVHLSGGDYTAAVNEGVKEAYAEGYLRKSIVYDPVYDRRNTGDNTPAVIHTEIVSGDQIHILVSPKGFGSENMSALGMLKPADGEDGVIDFVVKCIDRAGPNPCPPTVVGVGIGGTTEMAMLLAKKATTRDIGSRHPDKRYARMERMMLDKINNLGIGAAGLGGNATSLAVHVNTMPTHIAGMPVAVNVCCHAARHAEATI